MLKPKEVSGFYKRFSNMAEDFESARGEYMSDCKALFEEAGDKLGVPRSVVRKEFNHRRAEERRLANERDMEPSNRETMVAIRDALGSLADTPLGRAAQGMSQDEAAA